ncbi:MAG TPA: hypothetical protein DGZ24_06805 [Rhodospirillaceae bacterium]|nr:hypothetical protein [Candidatus Neomarinimicrobiota bacterium]HCX15010.1 hypothetical protein [Rhodospirillaceae bacterium]
MISFTRNSRLARCLWAWGLGTAVVVIALMVWADKSIALTFHAYRNTEWANFFAAITDGANGVIWYSISILGIGIAYLRQHISSISNSQLIKEVRAWLFMIVTMATSGIFINIVKFSVGRERPKFLFLDGTANFHPFTLRLADCAFPSGHTQSIWAAMLCLSFLLPKGRALFIPIAVLISASRFIIGAHYFSDVIASIFIAAAFTLLWRQWFERTGVTVALKTPAAQN